jgi:hypothetical protein
LTFKKFNANKSGEMLSWAEKSNFDWDYWRNTSSTTGAFEPILNDYLKAAGFPVEEEEPKTVEPEVEGEEKPNVGSRIKNFFGFGKK